MAPCDMSSPDGSLFLFENHYPFNFEPQAALMGVLAYCFRRLIYGVVARWISACRVYTVLDLGGAVEPVDLMCYV